MEPYIGEIRAFAGNFVPKGWLQCDGTLLQVSQYAALYSLLGTTYGGDGRNTFGLPDLRGRLIIQKGQLPGGSFYPLGQKKGEESVTLTTATMASHNHDFIVGTVPAATNLPNGNYLTKARDNNDSNAEVRSYLPLDTNDDTTQRKVPLNTNALTTEGGSQPHENRQPYLCVTYIIATVGVFPTSQ